MSKKSTKPKTQKPKPEPTVPEGRLEEFDKLVDRYMDTHNMTGEAAREKAYRIMGLSDGVLSLGGSGIDLIEGFKKAIRRARKGNKEAVVQEIMRQGARKGWKDYDKEVSGKYLTPKAAKDIDLSATSHADNIEILAQELIPVLPTTSKINARQQIELDLQRDALREIGRRAANRSYASFGAEDLYADQPVVKSKDEKEKSNWLKMFLRMKDLGLT